MRKIFSAFFVLSFILFLAGCNKEEPVVTTKYTIDSIRVESLLPYPLNNIVLVNGGADWPDLPYLFKELSFNSLIKSTAGDTTEYKQAIYRDNDSTMLWFNSVVLRLKENKLLYTYSQGNWVGGIGQDGAKESTITYQYDGNRISSINASNNQLECGNCSDNIVYSTLDSLSIYYSGNTMHQANYSSSYFDAGNYTYGSTYNASFHYPSNLSNQKDLIGIDVNDFILESSLNLSYKIPVSLTLWIGSPINSSVFSIPVSFEILDNMSYHTNSDKLIEEIHINVNNLTGTFDSIIKPVYEFDSLNDNRIKKITVWGLRPSIYTFYYKPQ